jgi:hypothetical protein
MVVELAVTVVPFGFVITQPTLAGKLIAEPPNENENAPTLAVVVTV